MYVFCFVLFCQALIKGSIFLKNRHFIIQESFNKLIYGINTMWHLAACISELMLPTLIQRYNKKNHCIFGSKMRDILKSYRFSDATFYDHCRENKIW